MDSNLENNINLIKKINTDDSRFIINVYETYKKYKEDLKNKIKVSSVVLKNNSSNLSSNVIDLDKIWVKPYFYTKMRIHLDGIIEQISNISEEKITQDSTNICRQIIFHNLSKSFEKTAEEIDIVDFIKDLKHKKSIDNTTDLNFTFIAQNIDEETVFKEEQLQKAIEIIKLEKDEEKYERVYNEVYSYLKKDFVANNYCDFKNNKCIAQRHFSLYPFNRKNGCCFSNIKTCKHLQENGSCDVECMACRLFSCPYLSKMGITYYASEFVLIKAFFSEKQKKHLVFDFYKSKSDVLKKIIKEHSK